ncbi:MAG: hypothetical protein HN931_08565 [Desulfobacterales bacterium]|jgi:hypothetical protein|nr:hypothetical protein [Desulfobacteraceae bacterium]MBT4364895.1 hypothetical protein [Desulfobacteraceae bacterium]MBT7086211.1 hypothetical protein [Desulfobacterales bacterium]
MRINGIKLSNELAQINLLNSYDPYALRGLFFRLLQENQINTPFVLVTGMEKKIQSSCCVDKKDINRVKKMAAIEPSLKENIELISDVGSLTLFPHHSNLKLLGLSFYIFGKTKLPIYGMASSISSLTFITDYSKLNYAFSAFQKHMDLSSNNTLLEPEIHVIQKKF